MDRELRQCLNELHGVCEHLEPLARSWELKRWRLQWRNGWIRLAKKLEKLLAGHPWRKNKLRWGGRPYFLSTLRIDSQRLASMERNYPGITAQIHRYDCCDLPTCPNCCSNDTAAVHVGLVGRSMNIAFATTKFRLLANGPKPGAYYCNQCGRYFDGSNEKQFAIRLTKWAILSIAIGALTAFVGYNSRPPNHNAPSDSTVAQSPEIRHAIHEPEMRRAIPAEPEIRKAMPVQTKEPEVDRPSQSLAFITQVPQEEEPFNKEIQIHKWDHWTDAGKTFRIGLFYERRLGDRKAEIDIIAKQLGARFYRLWEHNKFGNVEAVKVVFYK